MDGRRAQTDYPPNMTECGDLSRAYVKAFNDRDANKMRALLHSDVTYRVGGAPLFTGIAAVEGYYKAPLATDMRATTIRSIEQGDTVFIENQLTGTLPDGRTYIIEQAVLHRWKDGLLLEYRNYNDPPIIDGVAVTFEEFIALLSGR